MAYKLRRTESRSGVGPLKLYRALSPDTAKSISPGQPVSLTGDGFVERALKAAGLGPEPPEDPQETAAAAIRAIAEGRKYVEIAWAELAYEATRRRLAPELPSRIGSTFASLDPFEALSFRELSGDPYIVFPAFVPPGSRWCVTDMLEYSIPAFAADVSSAVDAYRHAERLAERYWLGPIAGRAEVIVAGPIVVVPHATRLLEVMRQAGLLEDQPLPG